MQHGKFVEGDPNITRFSTGHLVQAVTLNENFIMVEDPWLGDFVVTDPLAYRMYTCAAAIRSMGVGQLCTSMESATIVNTWDFTRFEGVIAQYPLVEKFGAMQRLSREHIDAIHIAVEPPDFAHFAFSHLAEQAIQKWGGPENFHEGIWPYVARIGGFAAVLADFGIQTDEKMRVPGYRIPEWAERTDRRDLDVDNLQYIAAEGLRTYDQDAADLSLREKIRAAVNKDNFSLSEDGRIVVDSEENALVIAKLIMLFSSGHYNDPLNRAHMHLRIHAMQRSITGRRIPWMDEVDCGETREPLGYYHGIDDDYAKALRSTPGMPDDFIYIVSNTLHSSGMEERSRFVDYKLPEHARFLLDSLATSFPSQYLKPKRVEFGPKPSTVDIEPVRLTKAQIQKLNQRKLPELDQDEDALSYTAGPLKNRFIDPLVRRGNKIERLSEGGSPIATAFRELMREHEILQNQGVKVRFAFNPQYAEEFRRGMHENDRLFQASSLDREKMTDDQRRRVLDIGANRAMELGVASGRLVLKRERSF